MNPRAVAVLASLLLLPSLAGCTSPESPPDSPLNDALQEELERAAPLEVPQDSPLEPLAHRHVVYVGGFLNEVIPGYFTDNARVVRDELADTTTLVFPSSGHALADDVAQIRSAILAAERPVVLVGHSKGGAASVLTVLREPELVLGGKVVCVVAIQGALGGSPVADGLTVDGAETWGPGVFRGLASLRTTELRPLFTSTLAALRERLAPADLERLSSRVFYARSFETRRLHVALELGLTYAYLAGRGSGRNDGLLLEEDMKLDAFGVDLGCVQGDHAALTVTGVLSTTSRSEREAFTRALFREVGDRLTRSLVRETAASR